MCLDCRSLRVVYESKPVSVLNSQKMPWGNSYFKHIRQVLMLKTIRFALASCSKTFDPTYLLNLVLFYFGFGGSSEETDL